MTWATAMGALGALALIAQLVQFLWQGSDRAERSLAVAVRSSEHVKKAIEDVSVAAVERSGIFATKGEHSNLADAMDELKALLREQNTKLDRVLLLLAQKGIV